MRLRAQWTGTPPKVGEYLMSTMRPKFAYRIIAVDPTAEDKLLGAIFDTPGAHFHRQDQPYTLVFDVERVSTYHVPDDAVVHSWKWDQRTKRGIA